MNDIKEHAYLNEHIEPACESCLDFRLNWTIAENTAEISYQPNKVGPWWIQQSQVRALAQGAGEVSTRQQRRKWALEMAAALLHSDMDNFNVDEVADEDEQDRYRDAVRKIADQLKQKAARIGRGVTNAN